MSIWPPSPAQEIRPGIFRTPPCSCQKHSEGCGAHGDLPTQVGSVSRASWAPSSCWQICCPQRRTHHPAQGSMMQGH